MQKDEEEEELAVLFLDEIPDKLTPGLLALAHLSDVEEEECSGPIRRKKKATKKADPYWKDEMKELEFRTNAWKPFKKN